jgi:hypothetical protein
MKLSLDDLSFSGSMFEKQQHIEIHVIITEMTRLRGSAIVLSQKWRGYVALPLYYHRNDEVTWLCHCIITEMMRLCGFAIVLSSKWQGYVPLPLYYFRNDEVTWLCHFIITERGYVALPLYYHRNDEVTWLCHCIITEMTRLRGSAIVLSQKWWGYVALTLYYHRNDEVTCWRGYVALPLYYHRNDEVTWLCHCIITEMMRLLGSAIVLSPKWCGYVTLPYIYTCLCHCIITEMMRSYAALPLYYHRNDEVIWLCHCIITEMTRLRGSAIVLSQKWWAYVALPLYYHKNDEVAWQLPLYYHRNDEVTWLCHDIRLHHRNYGVTNTAILSSSTDGVTLLAQPCIFTEITGLGSAIYCIHKHYGIP